MGLFRDLSGMEVAVYMESLTFPAFRTHTMLDKIFTEEEFESGPDVVQSTCEEDR